MFEQALCQVVAYLLPDCIVGMTLCLAKISPTRYYKTEGI